MSSVFIVTAGQYSAYHIVACFETREVAEQAVEIYNREGNYTPENGLEFYAAQVEEYPLLPDTTRTTEYRYQVLTDPDYGQGGYARSEVLWGPVSEGVEDSIGWNTDKVVGCSARALTPERAQKMAQDRAAEIMAREAGIA